MGQNNQKMLDPTVEEQIGDMIYPQPDKISSQALPVEINHVVNDTADFFNIPTAGGSEYTATMLMNPIVYSPDTQIIAPPQ